MPCLRCLILIFAATTSLSAADWPQFRGPAGDGHAQARNLPTTWNETTNVAWKTPIPGKGWSSPSLVAGKLYLTTAVPDAGGETSLRALCLDAATGKTLWDQEVFRQDASAPAIHTKNSHASPTPLVAGGRLYVHFGHRGTACLDLAGNVIWKATDHAYEPVHGNGCSPVLVAGKLIFSCDGAENPFVVALDAATGKEAWRFSRPGDPPKKFAFCTATVIDVGGQKQVVCPGAGVVNVLDPASGREIWRVMHGGYSVIPRPVFGHGMVYLSTSYDTPQLLAIRPDGKGDVTSTHVAWTAKRGAPHTPSPLLVAGELYLVADKGVATCLDAKSGSEHWTQRIGGNYSSSPVYADGKIYIQSEEGPATVIAPGKTYRKLADAGFKERTLASYAVGENALFIRTEKHLFRVQAR
jgi:outer membrane protein assembly factor BamB